MTQEEKRAYMKAWRTANKERIRQYAKEYRASTPELQAKIGRAYYAKVKADPVRMEVRRARWRANASKPGFKERERERCREYQQKRRADPNYRAEHASKAKARYWGKTEEERRELHASRRDYQRKYREKNKNRLKEHARAFHAANRERLNAKSREQYYRNPLPYIQRARKRMGLLTGTYTNADIHALYEKQRGKCAGCRRKLNGKYEIDHVMPLALDPSGDHIENLELLCRPCNRSKHAMHPDQWAKKIGRLFV